MRSCHQLSIQGLHLPDRHYGQRVINVGPVIALVSGFDYGGALLTTLGEPGEGPGEFRGRTEKAAVADQGSVADLEKREALLAALSA